MCGRFTLAAPGEELVEAFAVPPLEVLPEPRFNLAPGQEALVVGEDRRGRRMGRLRWGLVPPWVESPSRAFANARGESAERTPSFRDAFLHRRCLVPADGFYEWRRDPSGRTPFLFRPASGGLVALAGIWERWRGEGGAMTSGFALLTVAAGIDVAPVHDRMPLLVPPAAWAAWLAADTPLEAIRELVRPAAEGTLVRHEVSRRVNRTSEDDAGLIEPV